MSLQCLIRKEIQPTVKHLELKDLPEFIPTRDMPFPIQIKKYLLKIVKQTKKEKDRMWTSLPPAILLSGFFHCSIQEILNAFYLLQREGEIEFEMPGLDDQVYIRPRKLENPIGVLKGRLTLPTYC